MLCACGGDENPGGEPAKPSVNASIELTPADLTLSSDGETRSVTVKSNVQWTVSSAEKWCTLSSDKGYVGETSLKIAAAANRSGVARSAELTFVSGEYSQKYVVKQLLGKEENYVPEGYALVWKDEFNDSYLSGGKPALPGSEWYYETGASGWGNNEIQKYVAGVQGTDTCSAISEGTLKIILKKSGSEVLSARLNTQKSWTYGYFEARLKLPKGKGTWPAFWMMPKNGTAWPGDGEIDIMEEVGYDPNKVISTIHCNAYNHTIGTQKSGERLIPTAQTDFHVYAVEWTADYIKGFVDGECYFTFENDKKGNKDTWPFNAPFYVKLNLAWGGNWGGAQGIDESALPATYEIDYVRVFQKK